MNQPGAPPKVLIAPLDWGLGHATRCVPIIQELFRQKCQVLIAAEGKIKVLLQQEFPHAAFVHLPGYRINYAPTAIGLAAKIVAQIPKILSVIKEEETWLKKFVEKEKVDIVISDNRYGLHHPTIKCVFITHQLLIKAPVKIAEVALQKINYKYINQFDRCWVPDEHGEDNLAGILSHPSILPAVPLHYIGALSRFKKKDAVTSGNYILILLSGPEPQRTLLENILLEDLKEYKGRAVLVRGLPQSADILNVPPDVIVHNHLPSIELEEIINGASYVISRCGYSTVMDLAILKKRSILIPTPGQTEQAYLAKHLMKMNFALCIPQKKFRLKQALELSHYFPYQFLDTTNSDNLKTIIENLLKMG